MEQGFDGGGGGASLALLWCNKTLLPLDCIGLWLIVKVNADQEVKDYPLGLLAEPMALKESLSIMGG